MIVSSVSYRNDDLKNLFASPHFSWFSGYSHPELDQLLDLEDVTYDIDQRREILAQLQQLLSTDLPGIFLFSPHTTAVAARELENVAPPRQSFRPHSPALWQWRK